MSAHFQRAWLLFGQGKYDLCEQEIRLALAESPQDGTSHALLAMVLAERERFDEAEREAKEAVHLDPDDAFPHQSLARVLHDRRRYEEAEAAAREAIRLDPDDPDSRALLSQIRYNRRHWPGALEAAEAGLELEPEHVACTNLRAMALVKLGRKEEAGRTLEAALARDPEDAHSHASQGWALLEQNQAKKALEHFREALRLEPGNEFARAGIIEALKARNPLYAVMLKYFMWMSKLSGKAQWGIVIGGFIGYRMLIRLSDANPALSPYLMPLIIAYAVFAIMTWLAYPFFNLTLRLSRFGRHALSRDQTVAANFVGLCLGGALATCIAWLLGAWEGLALAAIALGLLTLPVSAVFYCSPGWPRRLMTVYTIGLALTAASLLGLEAYATLSPAPRESVMKAAPVLLWTFIIGIFLSQWMANFLAGVRPRR